MGEPLKRVLLPLDFSPASEAVVSYVSALAKRYRFPVTLFHAIEEWIAIHVAGGYDLEGLIRGLESRARSEIERYARMLEEAGITVDIVESMPVADPGAAIAEAAREIGASEIVMTTKGAGISRVIPLGSTFKEAVKLSSTPIIRLKVVQRGGKPEIMGSEDPFRKILAGIDRNTTKGFLEYSTALAARTGGKLIYAHVIEHGEEPEAEVKSLLRQAERLASQADVEVDFIVVTGKPDKALVQISGQIGATSMLLGKTVTRSIGELFLGSTLDRLLAVAQVPLIIYPASPK